MKKIKRKTINTESFEDVTHTNILKKEKGITLIALVVTIVILLVLAGVSINLVFENNGIITKSKEARIVTRADNAEDEVELWKGNNYIAKNSNGSSESENDMLQRLIDKKLVYEDEIDRNNEIITIKREDGTIVKEINYGGVVIHISKTPETEKAGTVVLQVASVEGIETRTINSDEDFQKLFEDIEALDKESQRDLIKRIMIADCNNDDSSTNDVNDFSEIVKAFYEEAIIKENTEDAFWKGMDEKLEQSNENYIDFIMQNLEIMFEYILKFDENNQQIIRYEIHNPDNELSDTYVATENGTYTFTVNDLLTGKTYTKSVEVNNVDSNLLQYQYYVAVVKNDDFNTEWCVGLADSRDNSITTFDKAYIMYNDSKIDISEYIENSDGLGMYQTLYLNSNEGLININNIMENSDGFSLLGSYDLGDKGINEGDYEFILVKYGIEIRGVASISCPPQ